MPFPDPLLIYQLLVLLVLVGLMINTVINLFLMPSPGTENSADKTPDPDPDFPQPLVSVLVPARNESGNIGPCVRSLVAQDYPQIEIIVLDDNSEDDTRSEAIEAARHNTSDVAFTVISGKPLPEGWGGKPWACHQLSEQAQGDWLLFTDADTEHTPHAVSAALREAQIGGATLFSAWPRQRMGSWSEYLIIPMLYVLAVSMLPHIFQHIARRFPGVFRYCPPSWSSVLGAACGQFMLFSRKGYELVGGHAAFPDHLVEDVALGRATMLATAQGGALLNVDGRNLLTCRMYRDWAGLYEGFSKNLRPVFEGSWIQFVVTGWFHAVFLVAPFIWVWWMGGVTLWIVLAQIAVILIVRLLLALKFKTPLWVILLHPISECLGLWIGLTSWWVARTGRISWKGREYKPDL